MQKEQLQLLIGIATPLLLVAILLIQLHHGQQNLTHAIIGLNRGSTTEAPALEEETVTNEIQNESVNIVTPAITETQKEESPSEKRSMEGAPPEIDGNPVTEASPLPGELIERPELSTQSEGGTVQLTYQPVTINHIYPRLQPFGRWFVHPRHGNVWMPRASSRDEKWRPYANNGQWHYTENGWHWQSNYKWGGTAFHHGRWFWHQENNGWVWVPGREWSPAWVTWRESGDKVGWAPVPPTTRIASSPTASSRPTSTSGVHIDYGLRSNHFIFVPKTEFLTENPLTFALNQEEALSAFQNSRSRDRITVTPKRAWANFGISRREMAQAIGSPIEMVLLDFRNPTQPRVVTMQEREEAALALQAENQKETIEANSFSNQEGFSQARDNPTAYWPGNRRFRNGSNLAGDQGAGGTAAPRSPIVINGTSDTTNRRSGVQQTNPGGLGMRRGQSRPNLSVRKPPSGK